MGGNLQVLSGMDKLSRALTPVPGAASTGDHVLSVTSVPGTPAVPMNGDSGAMADTASHTVVAAQGPGKKFYCTQCVGSNTHSTVGTEVAISGLDSGVVYHFPAAANFGGAVLDFDPPLIFAANTAATATCSVNGSNTFVSMNGYVV